MHYLCGTKIVRIFAKFIIFAKTTFRKTPRKRHFHLKPKEGHVDMMDFIRVIIIIIINENYTS